MLDFQKELLYLWILTLNYTIMKSLLCYLSMIAIALVSCTSELDEINNTVHQQETLSGNELGANLMKSFQNAVSRSSEIKHLSYPSYYGGAYLNKEGKLVVKVVNKTSEEIEKI